MNNMQINVVIITFDSTTLLSCNRLDHLTIVRDIEPRLLGHVHVHNVLYYMYLYVMCTSCVVVCLPSMTLISCLPIIPLSKSLRMTYIEVMCRHVG